MAIISVGVPVYNGEAYLEECLTCIEQQTLGNFEVLIFDNASTDRTGDIARAFAARDNRFKYVRQKENKGATQNFIDALHAAHAPYFLWRAHDDRSSDNFFEVMHRSFVERPQTKLAVAKVEKVKQRGAKRRIIPVADLNGGLEPLRLRRALFRSEASWFYGLWHRQTLIQEFDAVWKLYPFGWGSDHLTLLRLLVQNAVTGSNDATFIQWIESKSNSLERGGPATSAADMTLLKSRFISACHALLSQLDLTHTQRATLAVLVPLYADKRVQPAFKIIHAKLRDANRGVEP